MFRALEVLRIFISIQERRKKHELPFRRFFLIRSFCKRLRKTKPFQRVKKHPINLLPTNRTKISKIVHSTYVYTGTVFSLILLKTNKVQMAMYFLKVYYSKNDK